MYHIICGVRSRSTWYEVYTATEDWRIPLFLVCYMHLIVNALTC